MYVREKARLTCRNKMCVLDGIQQKIKYRAHNNYQRACLRLSMMTNVTTDSTMMRTTTTESKSAYDLSAFITSLPIICLQTANFDLTIQDVIHNKNTIIGRSKKQL